MRIILGAIKEFNDDALIMARQLGAEGFHFNTPPIANSEEKTWSLAALRWLKEYTEKFELRLEMIENVPIRFFDRILTAGEGRDEQIDHYIEIIRNMGALGIPILGHHFCTTWAWRTSVRQPSRGGALVSAYDQSIEGRVPNAYAHSSAYAVRIDDEHPAPTASQLWENFTYFMRAVLPEAEKAGVRLITHPSDPPLKSVAGAERIFISKEDFIRADEITASDAWGINLCLGTFSQLGGEPYVLDMIRTFVPRGKVSMVHFRDVQGTVGHFQECFPGDGNYDPAKVMTELSACAYRGAVLDDHVPFLTGDTRWGHLARAYTFGYLRGLLRMLNYRDESDA